MEGAPVYNPLSSSNSYKQNTFISNRFCRDERPARLIMKTPAKGFIVKPRRGDPITAGGERSITPGNRFHQSKSRWDDRAN